jgi:hypothetical protein
MYYLYKIQLDLLALYFMKVVCMEKCFLYFKGNNIQQEDSFIEQNEFFQEINFFVYQMLIFLVKFNTLEFS